MLPVKAWILIYSLLALVIIVALIPVWLEVYGITFPIWVGILYLIPVASIPVIQVVMYYRVLKKDV